MNKNVVFEIGNLKLVHYKVLNSVKKLCSLGYVVIVLLVAIKIT